MSKKYQESFCLILTKSASFRMDEWAATTTREQFRIMLEGKGLAKTTKVQMDQPDRAKSTWNQFVVTRNFLIMLKLQYWVTKGVNSWYLELSFVAFDIRCCDERPYSSSCSILLGQEFLIENSTVKSSYSFFFTSLYSICLSKVQLKPETWQIVFSYASAYGSA